MNDDFISRAETVKMLQALMGAAVTGPEQALVEAAVNVAESVPKADAEQVRHGKWVSTRTIKKYGSVIRCSACYASSDWTYKYCPHCGARMDLEGDQQC